MAKSKEKKPHPKPPADAKTVVAMKKIIDARKATLAKLREAGKKEGKTDRKNPKVRSSLKRVKRAQRRLLSEAYRLQPHKTGVKIAAPVAVAAEAAPAEGDKKE